MSTRKAPVKAVVAPAPAPAPVPEKQLSGLRRFNLVMGFLHLVQGILMIVLSNATTYPIYTNFLKFDLATRSLVPDPKLAYELPFGPAVAVFLLLSAVAHFSLATFGYNWYKKNLVKGMNPARFYEYTLSSSLMIVLIGMLVGDLGPGHHHPGLRHQRHDEPVRGPDGAAQSDNQEDRLDFVHLRLHRGRPALGRDRAVLHECDRLDPARSRRPSSTRSSRPSSCSSTSLR